MIREKIDQLTKAYSAEEVVLALKQMYSTKAPGPDGMVPLFYQKYWKIVGVKVSEAVLHALCTGTFPKKLNSTHIVPFLKKKNPELV